MNKSQLNDPLFGPFLVISEVESPDYKTKSANSKIWVFWVIFMLLNHFVIDIQNIRCLETFFTPLWPLWNSEVFGSELAVSISWNLVLFELFLFSVFLKCQRMFFEEILFWYAKTSEGCQSGLEGFIFFLQCLLVRKGQHCLPNGNWF